MTEIAGKDSKRWIELFVAVAPEVNIDWCAVGHCGFYDKTTAVGRFGKDVLAAAAGGLPGMILFGGKHEYCARIVAMGGSGDQLVHLDMGLVPVQGHSLQNVKVSTENAEEARRSLLKRIAGATAENYCTQIEMKSMSAECGVDSAIKIRGLSREEYSIGISLLRVQGEGIIYSYEKVIFHLRGLGNVPTSRLLVKQMEGKGDSIDEGQVEAMLEDEVYRQQLEGAFSKFGHKRMVEILSYSDTWPPALAEAIHKYISREAGRLGQRVFGLVASLILFILIAWYLFNGFGLYGDEEPGVLLGIVAMIVIIPLGSFVCFRVFTIIQSIRYGKVRDWVW